MAAESAPLAIEEAQAIWNILVEECGARSEHGFIHHQTHGFVTEWRFIGALGFGGKFWRNRSRRPDGSWGESWYVNYYPEDESAQRNAIQDAANTRLWRLLSECEVSA